MKTIKKQGKGMSTKGLTMLNPTGQWGTVWPTTIGKPQGGVTK